MNLWALLPKIQIKAVLFYAILNFSDFGLCYYNLWASVIMTLIFFFFLFYLKKKKKSHAPHPEPYAHFFLKDILMKH